MSDTPTAEISEPAPEATTTSEPPTASVEHLIAEGKVEHIPLEKVDLDDQTFMFRAALRTGPLKKSIRAEGQQLPIVVRKVGRTRGQRYQVISGFRRATAMRELGFKTVAAIVREDLDDDEAAFRASVVENEQRKTYSDIDRALVIRAHEQAGYSSVEAADLMGLSKRQKNNLKSLLDLPDEVKVAIDDPDSHFSATHGILLRRLATKRPALDVGAIVREVNGKKLSAAQMVRAANKATAGDKKRAGMGSIFNSASTDRAAGVFRLAPVKVVPADLGEEDRKRLKAELKELLKALG